MGTCKFYRHVTASDKSIKGTRAKVVVRAAKTAQTNLVNKLEAEYDKLDLKLETLNDVFPNSTTSLKVAENFDADAWAKEMQDTKISLLNKEVELKTAKKTYADWFTEKEEPIDEQN